MSATDGSSRKTQKATIVFNGDISHATFDLIEMASNEIISMEFLLRDDDFGMMKLALLRKKAREGKKVFVHVDSFHLLVDPAIVYHLSQEGVEFSVYNDLTIKQAFKFSYRNHCKFLIIDNKIFKTGDSNSGNEYVHWESDRKMKSLDLIFEGPLTVRARNYAIEVLKSPFTSTPQFRTVTPGEAETQRRRVGKLKGAMKSFLQTLLIQTDGPDEIVKPEQIWITPEELARASEKLDQAEKNYKQWRKANKSNWRANKINTPQVEFFSDPVSSDGKHSVVSEAVAQFITSTEHELAIVSPYLILTPKMKASLKLALDKGVKIKIYTNSQTSTDNRTTQLAYEYHFEEIAKLGPIELYEFKGPETLHAKMMIKDQKNCMMMTYNIDWRSEIKNLETALEFKSPQMTRQMQDWLDRHQNEFTLVAKGQAALREPLRDESSSDYFRRLVIFSIEKHL